MITYVCNEVAEALSAKGMELINDTKTLNKWMRNQKIKFKLSDDEARALIAYNGSDDGTALAMDNAGQLYTVKYQRYIDTNDWDEITSIEIIIKRRKPISFKNLCTLALAHCRQDVIAFTGDREEAMSDEYFDMASENMFHAEENKRILSELNKRIK